MVSEINHSTRRQFGTSEENRVRARAHISQNKKPKIQKMTYLLKVLRARFHVPFWVFLSTEFAKQRDGAARRLASIVTG
jgi:hypothetical protein